MKVVRKKGFWKKLLVGVLVGIAAITSVTALVKVSKTDTTKTLGVLDYSIASISTSTGKQIESNQNIVTKNYLSVDNMEITLDENATISYKVFFYDEDKDMLSSGGVTTSKTTDFDTDDIPETAKYFKVLITPAQVDGENVQLNFINANNYVSQISITSHK